MVFLIIAISLVFFFLLPWIFGFFISNDFSVKNGHIQKFKKILIIFPHPDDETLAAGGLIRSLTDQRSNVIVVVLTKGEKGNDDAHIDLTLKDTRKKELFAATRALGVKKVIMEDFGDGEIRNNKKEVTAYILDTIKRNNPDLIITYDLAGLYGHEDHIVVSEIVTDAVKKQFPDTTLWYTSLPKKMLAMVKLPEHMAKDPMFKKRRAHPTIKIFVGLNVFHRIRALYAYKSQLHSFSKGMPIPALPLWYYYSMQFFEFYAKAN
jgi:LmbE family N-acetylglucosaminyl deacetylase